MKYMNNILKEGIRNGLSKKAVSTMLAGALIFNGGALLQADAFSFDKPVTTYEDFVVDNGIKIFINGRLVEFNDSIGYPYFSNGRTMIPLRAVADTFNAHVGWNNNKATAYVDKHGKETLVRVGTNLIVYSDEGTAEINGKTIELDTISESKNGRTYVPLRAVFECFGLEVRWDANTLTAHIETQDNFPFVDFKDKKVMSISEVDMNKYSKIIYDGQEINKQYIDVLKNSNQYKVVEENNVVYIFSYQYLMDINYLYEKVNDYCNNLTTEKNISLSAISEEEIDFFGNIIRSIVYNPQRQTSKTEMVFAGTNYYVKSNCSLDKHDYVMSVVKEIVREARKTDDIKEQIKIVNNIIVNRIKYDKDNAYLYAYETLKYGVGGCGGFQSLFQIVMDELDIPCIKVSGMNGSLPHGWNQVLVDDEWYLVDISHNAIASNKEHWLFVPLYSKQANQFVVRDDDQEDIDIIKLTYKFD